MEFNAYLGLILSNDQYTTNTLSDNKKQESSKDMYDPLDLDIDEPV